MSINNKMDKLYSYNEVHTGIRGQITATWFMGESQT